MKILQERIDGATTHGCRTLGATIPLDSGALFELSTTLPRNVTADRLLFMDTETTGLSMDSLAFLLGLGFWSGDEFVVEQVFLEDPGEEPRMLEHFREHLKKRDVLVTFNGKRFDVPLLLKSYRRQGLPGPFGSAHHLDLLPAARRSIPGRRKYRLSSLERDLLEFHRVDDTPGREIPGLWHRYRRDRDWRLMEGVLEHNRHDIVSMVVLLQLLLGRQEPSKRTRISRRPVRESLERSYRLRGRFARADAEDGQTRSATSSPSGGADRDEAVEERLQALKGSCRLLIERGIWEGAFPLIAEILAIDPRDGFGVEMMVRYHRRAGNEALARYFEER